MRKFLIFSFFALTSSAVWAQGSIVPPFALNDILGASDPMYLGMWDSGYNFSNTGHNVCPMDNSPGCIFANPITLPNGTSSAPGLVFAGNSSAGIYYDTINSVVKIVGLSVPFSAISGTPTTLAGYGISNALSSSSALTLTGDVTAPATGLGTGTIATTLATVGTAGTYNNSATSVTPFTLDAKGRTTGTGTPITITPAWSSITSKPTTLSGYGISSVPWSAVTGAPTIPAAPLTGSVSITGGTVILGGCLTTVTTTIPGATTSNAVVATPAADPGPYILNAWVSAANTVSLRVCAGVAGTLSTQTWNIRVLQ